MPRGGGAPVPAGERSAGPPRVAVALPLPIFTEFTYSVRGTPPPPGSRVLVPFQRSARVGWVVGPAQGDPPRGLKPILSVLDREPTVTPDLLHLARWMSEYYVAPLGVVLASILPSVLVDATKDVVRMVGPVPGA